MQVHTDKREQEGWGQGEAMAKGEPPFLFTNLLFGVNTILL